MLGRDPVRTFLLRCANCADVSERSVNEHYLQRTPRGEFVPIECEACGEEAMSPTVRPWRLTVTDQRLLTALHITAE